MLLSDFDFVHNQNDARGKIIIVGMLEDGPTGTPFILKDKNKAIALLGDNEVTQSYKTLVSRGKEAEDIIIYRINGTPSGLVVEVKEKEVLKLQTLTSQEDGQSITFTVSEEGVSLTSNYPEEDIELGRKRNFKVSYRFSDYPTLTDLVEEITKDAIYGVHPVIAENIAFDESVVLAEELGPKSFRFGNSESSLTISNGVFPEEEVEEEDSYLSEYWDRFYSHVLGGEFVNEVTSKLMDVYSEVIYFPDVPINRLPELAVLAGRVAKQKTEEQKILCTALFRPEPIPQKQELQDGEYMNEDGTYYDTDNDSIQLWTPYKEQEEYLETLKNLYTIEERDYNEMKHVHIVVGEEITRDGILVPSAAHYAYFLTSQSLESFTNKELVGFDKINAILNKNEIAILSNKGYICTVESIRKNVVLSHTQSMFIPKREIDEFYYSRIMSYIEKDLGDIFNDSIGQSFSVTTISETEEVLSNYLEQYIDLNILQSFKMGHILDDEINGIRSIQFDLVLYGIIEKLNGVVKVDDSGWEVDLWSVM